MFSKYSRLKARRKLRSYNKSIQSKVEDANMQLERHLFRRNHNWKYAKRFIFSWMMLMLILAVGTFIQIKGLDKTYLVTKPSVGGVYSEGIVGNLKNANPLYATTSVDNAVSELVFSSLLTYNDENKLVGDIAKKWKAEANAKVYTITLRDDVYWHDGEKLTADDVVFTYKTILNPDAQSNLYNSWRSVKVEKVDDLNVKFTLKNSFSPFLHYLTDGIVPEHLLADVDPDQLRSNNSFNNKLVGSGPFKMVDIKVQGDADDRRESIQFVKNDKYYRGEVQLDGFNIKTYGDDKEAEEALLGKDVIGVSVSTNDLLSNPSLDTLKFDQTGALMLFINTQQGGLKDVKLRKALISATQPQSVSDKLPYPTIPVREALLEGQVGYNGDYKQLPPNAAEVDKLLNELGWLLPEGSQYRMKDGKELSLKLVSENSPEYSDFASEVQRQWAEYGIKTEVVLEDSAELTNNSLDNKDYDVLLYAINIGPDPDVYPYWHSSQAKEDAKPGLNLSRYESAKADLSLESGRSRVDSKLRAAKYAPFLEAWRADVPAIGIHQPVYLYTTNAPLYGLPEASINTPSDRYRSVHNWQINTNKVIE